MEEVVTETQVRPEAVRAGPTQFTSIPLAPKGTPKEAIDLWAQIFKQAAEDEDLRKQMDAKGTEVNWVGPAAYREWADQTFADHKKVAIKIGMWTK